jgi:hypothetical protein
MLNSTLLREVDELKLPSKRQGGNGGATSTQGGEGPGLFDSPSIKLALSSRRLGGSRTAAKKESEEKELQEDGYLFVNLWIVGSKIGPRFADQEARNTMLECIWEEVVTAVSNVMCSRRPFNGKEVFPAGAWCELSVQSLSTLRLFFHSGGDGVPLTVLDKVRVRDPELCHPNPPR